MLIDVYSRVSAESLDYSKFDEHIIISICTHKNLPAKLNIGSTTKSILRLCFADADTKYNLAQGLDLFTKEHAIQILNFIIENKDVKKLIIHCDAGISRSPAIAAAISKILYNDDNIYFKVYKPNMHVYRTILNTHRDYVL